MPKLFEDHAYRAQFKKLVMSPIQSKKKMISLLRVRDVADAYPAFRTWSPNLIPDITFCLWCYRTHINFYSRQCLFFKYNENTVNEIPNSTEYSDDITIGIDDFTFIYSFSALCGTGNKVLQLYVSNKACQTNTLFIYICMSHFTIKRKDID